MRYYNEILLQIFSHSNKQNVRYLDRKYENCIFFIYDPMNITNITHMRLHMFTLECELYFYLDWLLYVCVIHIIHIIYTYTLVPIIYNVCDNYQIHKI